MGSSRNAPEGALCDETIQRLCLRLLIRILFILIIVNVTQIVNISRLRSYTCRFSLVCSWGRGEGGYFILTSDLVTNTRVTDLLLDLSSAFSKTSVKNSGRSCAHRTENTSEKKSRFAHRGNAELVLANQMLSVITWLTCLPRTACFCFEFCCFDWYISPFVSFPHFPTMIVKQETGIRVKSKQEQQQQPLKNWAHASTTLPQFWRVNFYRIAFLTFGSTKYDVKMALVAGSLLLISLPIAFKALRKSLFNCSLI